MDVMDALVLDAYGLSYRVDVPVPRVGRDEVLLRVKAVGICGTDVAIISETLQTPKPIIPGHEIAATIEAAGAGVPDRVRDMQARGALVTTEINTGTCGSCFFCTSGMPTQCPSRKALGIDVNGGMATFVSVRHDLVHELPAGTDPRQGTLVEPLAAAVQTFERMSLHGDDRHVAIIGAGRLGLLVLQVLVARSKDAGVAREILVLDHHPFKLDLARQFGATRVLDTSKMPDKALLAEVNTFAEGKGVDVTIEATGNPRALNQAVYMTRPRGTVALKSTHGVPVPFDLTVAVVKELAFSTSRCGPFDKAIALLRDGRVDLAPLVTEVMPLSRGVQAFKDISYRKGDAIKYVLEPR